MCVDDKFDLKAQKLYWRSQLSALITQFLLYMGRIFPSDYPEVLSGQILSLQLSSETTEDSIHKFT